MRSRTKTNPKREIRLHPDSPEHRQTLEALAQKVSYTGNPAHKRHPGDFALSPPSAARPDKTLCDGAQIFKRKDALSLLREGIRRGLVSV